MAPLLGELSRKRLRGRQLIESAIREKRGQRIKACPWLPCVKGAGSRRLTEGLSAAVWATADSPKISA